MSTHADITIVCRQDSPRLRYVCEWIFSERLGLTFTIATPVEIPSAETAFVLSYGITTASDQMYCCGLLEEVGIVEKHLEWSSWQGIPAFFTTRNTLSIPFDLFAAVFYLISRYEEYTNVALDKHERFDARQSCLYKQKVLERPVVDEWVSAFASWLKEKGLPVRKSRFRFVPTYDIDIAWSYQYKGWLRNAGGYIRDMMRGNIDGLLLRTKVLQGKAADPYDSFDFLDQLHRQYTPDPLYFILAARNTDTFDKNITPDNPAMRSLILRLSQRYTIGLHPSYQSSVRERVLQQEQQIIEVITGTKITRSRQHYIRFRLPDTFRMLLRNHITEDFSMGYGTHPGFRAGTGNPFQWYDLLCEEKTKLRITPFCFMDTTAHYECSLSAAEAFALLRRMRKSLTATGSMMVTVFHNFSLGSDPEWKGWRSHYEEFIQLMFS